MHVKSGVSSAYEQSVLLGPVERQVELGQSRCGEHDGLSALQDHANELWAQEGEVNKAPDVAPGDAVALGQILQRSGAAGGQVLKPCVPACDRLDQRRITFRGMVVLRQPGQQRADSGRSRAPMESREFDRIGPSAFAAGTALVPQPTLDEGRWPRSAQ